MALGKACRYVINIEPTANQGFIVNIGCARLAYANKEDLIAGISKYLNDPQGMEEAYYQQVPE